jgi:iron complex outermembrane recepter protein
MGRRQNGFARRAAVPMTAAALCSAFSASHAAEEASADADVLQEVTVTAQKRVENLQSTPLAITALSSDDIDRAGIREFTELDKLVPGVRVDRVVSMPRVSIRGIFATNLSPTSESPNAVHMDGVYLPKASALGGMFFDVDRVEVLKGPQGTLYGRNSNGGALNIISHRPERELGGSLQAEVGNYSLSRVEAVANVPFGETVAARVAIADYRHDGYYNVGLEDAGETSGRVSLLWEPGEQHRLLFTSDYEKIANNGYGVPNAVASSVPGTVIPGTFDGKLLYGSRPPFFYDSKQYGFMAQYDYDTPVATFTVQAGHRHQDSDDFLPGVGGSLNPAGQFTQSSLSHEAGFTMTTLEARLTSASNDPIEWVAGVFGMKLLNSGGIRFHIGVPASKWDPASVAVEQGNPSEDARAYAAFAQATYTPDASKRLHLTLGARYTYDEKHAVTTTSGVLIPDPDDRFEGSANWGAATWRMALAYDLSADSMLYTSASRGYAAGGFAFAPYGQNPEYKPEFVTAYEIGSKNRFLNDRLQVNFEAFYNDYKDLSSVYAYLLFSPLTGPALVIGIANGDATYQGATLDVQSVLTRRDRLAFAISYLDAKRAGYDLRPLGPPGLLSDLSGTHIPSSPPWSGNASYTHTFGVFGGSLDAAVALQYRKRMLVDVDLPPTVPTARMTHTGTLTRWDFSLRYAPDQGTWDVSGYVRNLTNSVDYSTLAYTYNAAAPNNPGAHSTLSGIPQAPRTYGVIFNKQF